MEFRVSFLFVSFLWTSKEKGHVAFRKKLFKPTIQLGYGTCDAFGKSGKSLVPSPAKTKGSLPKHRFR